MGRTYKWKENPFQDYLFYSIMHDGDIADKKYEADIYSAFVSILDYMMQNKTDSHHLDFEIKKKDTYFKVVGKNMITALWLSGIFPHKPNELIESKEYVLENTKYRYNPKTKKLTQRLIKK